MKNVLLITALLTGSLFSCKSDVKEPTSEQVQAIYDRQITWLQSGKRYTVNRASASLIIKPEGQVLNMTAKNEEIGIVLQTFSENGKFGDQTLSQEFVQTGEYNSLKVYVAVDKFLSIFISERCRPVEGSIIIDNMDLQNHLVSGRFFGKVCKGSSERLKDNFQMVTEGQFKNLPLSVVEQ